MNLTKQIRESIQNAQSMGIIPTFAKLQIDLVTDSVTLVILSDCTEYFTCQEVVLKDISPEDISSALKLEDSELTRLYKTENIVEYIKKGDDSMEFTTKNETNNDHLTLNTTANTINFKTESIEDGNEKLKRDLYAISTSIVSSIKTLKQVGSIVRRVRVLSETSKLGIITLELIDGTIIKTDLGSYIETRSALRRMLKHKFEINNIKTEINF